MCQKNDNDNENIGLFYLFNHDIFEEIFQIWNKNLPDIYQNSIQINVSSSSDVISDRFLIHLH